MNVSGKLRLSQADREARLDEGAKSTLMTTDTQPGHLSDKGRDGAYKYFSNLPGVGNGTKIDVEATSTYVLGFGYVLQVKI